MTATAPHALCDTASGIAYRVADLLSSPEQVAGAARDAFAALPPELPLPGWQPASLLNGHPGIALLHTRCARTDARYAGSRARPSRGGRRGDHRCRPGRGR